MVQSTPMQQARQGNMSALEAMMNRTLNRQGITARTSLKDGRLKVLLEADMLGGFSILLVLFSLWRFHRLFNPLLQILLQHDKQ